MGDLILWLRLSGHGRLRRVNEPLASWRRHAEGATSQVGLDHAREHVRVAELGHRAAGRRRRRGIRPTERRRSETPASSARSSAATRSTPAVSPWATIDLQRPTISAYGAGMQWNELPDERAEVATKLWRELARKAAELAALRTPDGRDRADSTPPASSSAAPACSSRQPSTRTRRPSPVRCARRC